MDDIFIHELDLPPSVRASTIPDENGDFTILINSNLCVEAKKTVIEHEMTHIKHDHFYRDLAVTADEYEARSAENSVLAEKYLANIRFT